MPSGYMLLKMTGFPSFFLWASIWASLIAKLVKNPPPMQETLFDSWVSKIAGEGATHSSILELHLWLRW